MLTFLIGLFVGAFIGIILSALMISASQNTFDDGENNNEDS